jgi:hypothetical protein
MSTGGRIQPSRCDRRAPGLVRRRRPPRGVAVPAGDRERLEHLVRYVLRPPVAQDALALTADGKILLNMRRAWHDGTRAILFEPHQLIERLAALVPKPRINLLLYHRFSGRVPLCGATRLRRPGRSFLGTSRSTSRRGKDRASDPAPLDEPGPAPPSARGTNASGAAHDSSGGSPGPRPVSFSASASHVVGGASTAHVRNRRLAGPECGGRLRLLAPIEDPWSTGSSLISVSLPVPAPCGRAAAAADRRVLRLRRRLRVSRAKLRPGRVLIASASRTSVRSLGASPVRQAADGEGSGRSPARRRRDFGGQVPYARRKNGASRRFGSVGYGAFTLTRPLIPPIRCSSIPVVALPQQ